MARTKQWLLLIINLLGGSAVLGSYAYSFQAHPDAANLLWGGVPIQIRPFITANMPLAALGYFAFTYYILFGVDPAKTRLYNRLGYGIFSLLYAAILLPSAIWAPLTLLAVGQANPGLAWMVRLVLASVACASLALLLAIWKISPPQSPRAHKLAQIGMVFFCIQTVLLDAILWTAFFR